MSEATTMEKLQTQHDSQTESNRALDVAAYKSGEKQSSRVFEVTDGLKYLPGGKVLGPGMRFHPTERQVENGSLKNKARELNATEMRGLSVEQRRTTTEPSVTVAGADIGVRALPISSKLATEALAAGLTEADFEGIDPAGNSGKYTRGQVEELIAQHEEAGAGQSDAP